MKNLTGKYIKRILMLAVIIMLYAPFQAHALTVSDVEESLTSPSCPGEALNQCKSGPSNKMRAQIKKMIKEGKSEDEILDYFVKIYGERILSIPPKRGFNLVAYIAPFAGLLVGGVIAFLLVKKWGKKAQTSERVAEGTDAITIDMQKKIDDELNKLEEED